MAMEWTLSTGKLPLGGLRSSNDVTITDHPDMTSAVYRGRKAPNQTKKPAWINAIIAYQYKNHFNLSHIFSI